MKSISLIFLLVSSLFGIDVTTTTPDAVNPTIEPAAAEELDVTALAECLTEKGAKLYGAYWCGHCNNQKEMFGEDLQYITYIECDANGEDADAAACQAAGIRAYPTWVLADEEQLVGTKQLEVLKEATDC